MKKLALLLLLIPITLFAKPTEERTWTATNGKTVTAAATSVDSGKVSLKKSNGKTIQVPIATFIPADQELLKAHFADQPEDTPTAETSDSEAATGLPQPQGQVVGPIETGNDAKYFLYLPNSLKKGRRAPLLFYTHSGGGNKDLIKKISEGAETCGWILAISVESKNANPGGFKQNIGYSERSIEHIIKTLPVDKDRIYFTGNSGGGATSLANSAKIKNMGAMPNVGYIPDGYEPKGKDFFIIGGGHDYNRYTSAHANKELGKKAIHRMHPGGHGVSPNWLYIDGMIWFQTRFLEREQKDHQDEAKDFEASIIKWINEKKAAEPYRAYATAKMLLTDYEPSSANKPALEALEKELSADPKNPLYYQALQDINELSEKNLADFGAGSLKNHSDPKVTKAAEKLLKKYTGIPIIEPTLKAIAGKTK